MGAPVGNQNARKAKVWSAAIEQVLMEEDGPEKRQKLYLAAKKLVDRAMDGDVQALKEIGDRIEGKVSQPIEGSLDLTHRLVVNG